MNAHLLDGQMYEITILAPFVYRVRATDVEQAKYTAAALWMSKAEAQCIGFPETVTVKELEPLNAG